MLTPLWLCVFRGVTLVAPAAAAPGRPTAVLVTLRSSAPVNVSLRLVADRVEEATQLLASAYQPVRGQGIVPLAVPPDASGPCILQAFVNCSGGGGAAAGAEDECSLQASTQLTVLGAVREVLVQPAKHLYRPGETVFFWVLALDHSLRGAQDVTGSVSVREPSGVRVALWEEVALDEGVKEFSVELSAAAAAGAWGVEVQADGATFAASFNVTAGGGGGGGVAAAAPGAVGADEAPPEVPMAEEHFVELRFGPDMRRLYKPGLPFVGRVEAVSSERCVRVRVKVYDNTTAIYSQDVEITSGEGMFVVPAILADSDVITLQAELVSVEGKEIDSHYVLAREPVRKWRSPSDCYLLVEGLEHTLQPAETARATVLSTCPCTRPLHYLVTTGGRATLWGALPPATATSSGPDSQRSGVDGAAICRMNFTFAVEDIMAPMSHLLVYYVTEEGEPISDVVSFDVKLLLKDVSVVAEARKYWLPGQQMTLNVSAEEGALVCLIGGGGPGTGDPRPPSPDPQAAHDGKRRRGAAAEADFLAAGVALFQRRCERRREARPRPPPAGPAPRPRSLLGAAALDRLWLWRCFNYSAEGSAGAAASQGVSAPEEPGKWALWALTLSPGAGLRVSPPLGVAVFRPLAVFFSLPAALRVGETVEVDVRIGNNINSCMDVTALLALTEGAHFLSNGLLYVTEKLRLGPHGATSLVVRVVVTSAGDKNLTVEVSGYSSESCRDPTVASINTSLVGSVLRSAVVSVRPEGLVKTATESAYFCANENMVISTSEEFRYEFVSAPRNRAALVFEVRAASAAHVALSDVRYTSERMYQVVLGDLDNSVSWIGRGKHGYGVHLTTASTPRVLEEGAFRTFWVSWGGGAVAVGRGPLPGERTLLKWRADKKLRVQHIGFASAWGRAAEFRVWNYNDEAGFSQVLHLDVPQPVVPGSEAGSLLIAGGLSLPSAAQWPLRARSTSLSAAAAAFSALPLLQEGSALANGSWPREEVLRRMRTHVQELLGFRLPDGSFSDLPRSGSHRGTVQVVRVLARLQAHAGVDPDLVAGAKRWLQRRQAADGSFPAAAADGGVPEPSDGGPLDRDVARTAETLAALLQIGLESEADTECALRARYFLERHVFRVSAPAAVALQAHALAEARSDLAPAALDLLRNASHNEEGDFGWPRASAAAASVVRDAPDWLYEEGAGRHRKEPVLTSVGEFKASLFTLITYARLGDLKSAEPVARYLFYRSHLLDRHLELLYPAVWAFSEFASLALDKHRALTVSLATSGMELTDTLELRPGAGPRRLQLPSLPTKVFVYATGAGCATVQGRVSYSTYAPAGRTRLLDLWAGVEGELAPGHNSLDELEGKLPRLRIKACFRWKGDEPSGILRLEVTLFSGFHMEAVSSVDGDAHYGSHGDLVWFVLTNVSSACPTCVHFLVRSPFVVSGLRPAFARVYPAAREDLSAEAFFHTRRGSALLADITDDDLITWFGKDERGQPRMGADFSEVCECGQACREPAFAPAPTPPPPPPPGDLDRANVLILSEANTSGNVTQFTVTSAQVTLRGSREGEGEVAGAAAAAAALALAGGNGSFDDPLLFVGDGGGAASAATEPATFDLVIPAEDADALGAKPEQLVIIAAANLSEIAEAEAAAEAVAEMAAATAETAVKTTAAEREKAAAEKAEEAGETVTETVAATAAKAEETVAEMAAAVTTLPHTTSPSPTPPSTTVGTLTSATENALLETQTPIVKNLTVSEGDVIVVTSANEEINKTEVRGNSSVETTKINSNSIVESNNKSVVIANGDEINTTVSNGGHVSSSSTVVNNPTTLAATVTFTPITTTEEENNNVDVNNNYNSSSSNHLSINKRKNVSSNVTISSGGERKPVDAGTATTPSFDVSPPERATSADAASFTTPPSRSINKERRRGGSPGSTPPTLGPASDDGGGGGGVEGAPEVGAPTSAPSAPAADREKLFVLDRDALWGMLREVVHVELNKRERRADGAPPADVVLH